MSNEAYHLLISNKREGNNCFFFFSFYNQEILQDLAEFALQEQPEDNLMAAHIPWPLSQSNYWNCIIQ